MRAAVELLAEQGTGGLTVRAVTERAEVAHGTFYHHFPSTEALIPEAIEVALRDLAAAMEQGWRDAPDKVWVFVASVCRTLRMLARHPALPWMIERPHLLAAALREACGPFVRRDVDAMVAAGDVGPHGAGFLDAYWEWVVVGALVGIERGTRTIDAAEDELVRFFCQALGIDDDRACATIAQVRHPRRPASGRSEPLRPRTGARGRGGTRR